MPLSKHELTWLKSHRACARAVRFAKQRDSLAEAYESCTNQFWRGYAINAVGCGDGIYRDAAWTPKHYRSSKSFKRNPFKSSEYKYELAQIKKEARK